MGNASSSSHEGPGPQLSLDEKMAILSPDSETWLKSLENRADPTRRAIVDILAPAVFASTSMDATYDNLANDLLRVCNSDSQRLTSMLRTPFLDGQAPIVWAICNIPANFFSSSSWDKLPPVLSALLESCPGWQNIPSIANTIYGACCIRNSNELFQLLNPHSKSPSSLAPVYTLVKRGTGSGCEFDFVIHDFPTCMLVDGKVDMWFVCESRLCSVGFAVRGSGNKWVFFRRVVQDDPKASGFLGEAGWPRFIHIDLIRQDGSGTAPSVFKQWVCRFARMEDTEPAETLKNANDFVGADRSLRGCIRICKDPRA
ncbi:hypothetical protein BKA70DRAFT_1311469 [Coprinopsis sp. MPI-PUGE-AT-0042]|nr:hypothetical protein BKA70DRAFT_1311469 [Coprinopsis sp. MPI-PUGE-AT-0042]